MRLGIIGSSGGAAISAAVACIKDAKKSLDVVVATDRECGVLTWARRHNYQATLIPYADALSFSTAALGHFESSNVDCVLLFYTRLLAGPLLGGLPVYNIHPSLLPCFRGLNSLRQALNAKTRIIGATLHVVSDELDAGPIVAQISSGLPSIDAIVTAEKISYLQKVYLTLLLYELTTDFGMAIDKATNDLIFKAPPPHSTNASPCLTDFALARSFDSLQKREQCGIVNWQF